MNAATIRQVFQVRTPVRPVPVAAEPEAASASYAGAAVERSSARPAWAARAANGVAQRVMSHPALAPLATHGAHVNGLDVSGPLLPPPVALAVSGRPAKRFGEYLDQAPAYRYRQTGYQLVDPVGDASLIKRLGGEPLLVGRQFVHKVAHRRTPEAPTGRGFETYRAPSMDARALTHRVIEDIQSSPYSPTIGEEHQWSPEAQAYLRGGAIREMGRFVRGKDSIPIPLLHGSKLFYMLANGRTAIYAVTGQEQALDEWVMRQPDRSIQPHDLIRESYNLNQGDLYKTLMTCENVLNVDWTDPQRSEQPIQSKLAYIRNDSAPHGDNYGAWYHFMGMALYSLMRSKPMASAVVNTEAVGSYILGGPDRQEDEMGRLGVQLGSNLQRTVQDGSWQIKLPPGTDTQYLRVSFGD